MNTRSGRDHVARVVSIISLLGAFAGLGVNFYFDAEAMDDAEAQLANAEEQLDLLREAGPIVEVSAVITRLDKATNEWTDVPSGTNLTSKIVDDSKFVYAEIEVTNTGRFKATVEGMSTVTDEKSAPVSPHCYNYYPGDPDGETFELCSMPTAIEPQSSKLFWVNLTSIRDELTCNQRAAQGISFDIGFLGSPSAVASTGSSVFFATDCEALPPPAK